jgi:hypothetical protein
MGMRAVPHTSNDGSNFHVQLHLIVSTPPSRMQHRFDSAFADATLTAGNQQVTTALQSNENRVSRTAPALRLSDSPWA